MGKYEVWVHYRLCDPQVDHHCDTKEEAEKLADEIREQENVKAAWVMTEKSRHDFANEFEDECSVLDNGVFE